MGTAAGNDAQFACQANDMSVVQHVDIAPTTSGPFPGTCPLCQLVKKLPPMQILQQIDENVHAGSLDAWDIMKCVSDEVVKRI